MVYCLHNISTKNHQNQMMWVEVSVSFSEILLDDKNKEYSVWVVRRGKVCYLELSCLSCWLVAHVLPMKISAVDRRH